MNSKIKALVWLRHTFYLAQSQLPFSAVLSPFPGRPLVDSGPEIRRGIPR
mgnify:CR=1 FL=1